MSLGQGSVALFRVATSEYEEELLVIARSCTAAQLERVVRAYRKAGRAELDTAQRQLCAEMKG